MADAASALEDVLPRGAPTGDAAVEAVYGGTPVVDGVALRVPGLAEQPAVSLCGADASASYALLLVDPDAPSPADPSLRSSLHWLITNIPGSLAPGEDVAKKGTEVLPYKGPAPAEGRHRYIFLLYKQAERVEIEAPKERDHFDFSTFATQHNLGPLLAAPYFYAEPQESQPRV
eukprot:SM000005S17200  [mRNA]  locus=s5:740332:741331:- [translate_table: standard]